MIQFWLVCFGILFVMVQVWEWLQQLTLALPVCLVGGLVLAIASNLNFSTLRRQFINFSQQSQSSSNAQLTNATTRDSISD